MIAIKAFEVISTDFITQHVKHIALRPCDGGFHYIPGQFITVHFDKAGQMLRRSYSIASIPGRDHTIDFAASYVENGPGSAYLFNLKPGDVMQVSGPFGRLILKEEAVKRLLLLSTGTGITPYRAMLPALSEIICQRPDFQVLIAQGVQYRKDVLYPNDFLAWAAQHTNQAIYRTYLSREDLATHRAEHEYKGYVQSVFDDLSINTAEDVVYLCGNPNMIDQAFLQLQTLGMATSQIRREKYISSK